jgi:hypothetical protein
LLDCNSSESSPGPSRGRRPSTRIGRHLLASARDKLAEALRASACCHQCHDPHLARKSSMSGRAARGRAASASLLGRMSTSANHASPVIPRNCCACSLSVPVCACLCLRLRRLCPRNSIHEHEQAAAVAAYRQRIEGNSPPSRPHIHNPSILALPLAHHCRTYARVRRGSVGSCVK